MKPVHENAVLYHFITQPVTWLNNLDDCVWPHNGNYAMNRIHNQELNNHAIQIKPNYFRHFKQKNLLVKNRSKLTQKALKWFNIYNIDRPKIGWELSS